MAKNPKNYVKLVPGKPPKSIKSLISYNKDGERVAKFEIDKHFSEEVEYGDNDVDTGHGRECKNERETAADSA